MKSEREIRRHRDNLKKCAAKPCDCAGGTHEFEWFCGGRMMAAAIGELSWVLDEAPEKDRMVEHMAQSAKEV